MAQMILWFYVFRHAQLLFVKTHLDNSTTFFCLWKQGIKEKVADWNKYASKGWGGGNLILKCLKWFSLSKCYIWTMRVQRLVICIDYDKCAPIVYKCNKTKDVRLCLSHTIGYIDRYSKQWSHDRCNASKCLWVLFLNN